MEFPLLIFFGGFFILLLVVIVRFRKFSKLLRRLFRWCYKKYTYLKKAIYFDFFLISFCNYIKKRRIVDISHIIPKIYTYMYYKLFIVEWSDIFTSSRLARRHFLGKSFELKCFLADDRPLHHIESYQNILNVWIWDITYLCTD